VIAIIGVFLLGHLIGGATLNVIARDPIATLGGDPLTGVQSSLGVVIWWSAAAVCLFSWAVVRRAGDNHKIASFLLWSGLITAWLAFDDLFMFHDGIAQEFLGLRERAVVASYLLVIGLYLVWFRKTIRRSEWLLLAVSLALFAGSIVGDFVSQQMALAAGQDTPPEELNYFEDVLKLLGIVGWSAYFIRFSLTTVLDRSDHDYAE